MAPIVSEVFPVRQEMIHFVRATIPVSADWNRGSHEKPLLFPQGCQYILNRYWYSSVMDHNKTMTPFE